MGVRTALLDIEGNWVDKYRSIVAVKEKMRISGSVNQSSDDDDDDGGQKTTLVYTRVFRLYGLYTQL